MTQPIRERPPWILPVIVLAELAGTSLWFAGNAVAPELQAAYGLPEDSAGLLTQAVQLGFICGTLAYAALGLADRFSARLVFLLSCLAAAAANAALLSELLQTGGAPAALAARFGTGVFLAGVYPVGMKIAAAWYSGGLGRALGYLVGALALGTALPHLLQATGTGAGLFSDWRGVLGGVSALACCGGALLYLLVPDGPHLPHSAAGFDWRALGRAFRLPGFRRAAFGYFGHMWELYAFWAFAPALLAVWLARDDGAGFAVLGGLGFADPERAIALLAFAIIAAGAPGCVIGGAFSSRYGSASAAVVPLAVSGALCLLGPALVVYAPGWIVALALVLWGAAVVGDSPQFSALAAAEAPREAVGSALTLLNSIGFALTIPAIQLLDLALRLGFHPAWIFVLLAPGPLLGLFAMRGAGREHRA